MEVQKVQGNRDTLAKLRTGISGLDEITFGGVPKGRPTLICGTAGCGKTLFAMEFLLRGALDYGENGAFIAFEETAEDLSHNVRSLGFDLDQMVADNRISVDHVQIEHNPAEAAGAYDLEGLFLRIALAIETVGAKRVVLDTIETLYSQFTDPALLRSELRRLFMWLRARGVTTVLTAERGEGSLTRHGFEEYVSDCVILLDHRVEEQISTRRLRIVKYRGSTHGTNEYPFLIDEAGIWVLPLSSVGLEHPASDERISSGVRGLDEMLGGEGYYRGSTVLLSGASGTGKTSLAAHFSAATCARGERCLYLAFEESPQQLMRNMATIGIDLDGHLKSGLLRIEASRPTLRGLELHLVHIHKVVAEFKPKVVVLDPISSFESAGTQWDVQVMILRLLDYLKSQGITALFTHLAPGGEAAAHATVGVSSLVDTWILLRDIELGGERNKALYVIKARGMPHSNQLREYLVTPTGIHLEPVYRGPEGVLTGSMRASQEGRERAADHEREQASVRRRRLLDQRRSALEVQIAALRAEVEAVEDEAQSFVDQHEERARTLTEERTAAGLRRGGDTEKGAP
ncbi:MAG: circadian clock protein KaiC [Deltaproteobacteria bacterium]|nr:circadian clock protein KaiC [Deltaproteobacteria bacterium]